MEIPGVYMDCSLADFVRACESFLYAEGEKFAPDTHLIALLCNAIRLTRELALKDDAYTNLLRDYLALKLQGEHSAGALPLP